MTGMMKWDAGKWNPFKEMEDLSSRLSSLFDRSVGRLPAASATGEENLVIPEWTPLVDISEDDKEYLLKVELPEVNKEDVSVTLENGVLSIRGERKAEKEEKGKRYHRIERAYGSFMRNFAMPEDADPTKVAAEFKEGVLKVHVTKSEVAKPKAIEIKVG